MDARSHRLVSVDHTVDVVGTERLSLGADQSLLVQGLPAASGARFVEGTQTTWNAPDEPPWSCSTKPPSVGQWISQSSNAVVRSSSSY
jgi:hypothetical protein